MVLVKCNMCKSIYFKGVKSILTCIKGCKAGEKLCGICCKTSQKIGFRLLDDYYVNMSEEDAKKCEDIADFIKKNKATKDGFERKLTLLQNGGILTALLPKAEVKVEEKIKSTAEQNKERIDDLNKELNVDN